jgi:hypothetical protein
LCHFSVFGLAIFIIITTANKVYTQYPIMVFTKFKVYASGTAYIPNRYTQLKNYFEFLSFIYSSNSFADLR